MSAPTVIIFVEGGVVQHIMSSVPVEAYIVDYDVEGFDSDRIREIPQTDGPPEEAGVSDGYVELDPERVSELKRAIEGGVS